MIFFCYKCYSFRPFPIFSACCEPKFSDFRLILPVVKVCQLLRPGNYATPSLYLGSFTGKPSFLLETSAQLLARSFFDCYLLTTTKIFLIYKDGMFAIPAKIFSLVVTPTHFVHEPFMPFLRISIQWLTNSLSPWNKFAIYFFQFRIKWIISSD